MKVNRNSEKRKIAAAPFFTFIGSFFFSFSSFATPVELPRPSPAASVFEKIGTARVTVTYSRPAVKGREIWGGLVPYGQVWRLGANDATTLEVSEACKVAGHDLAADAYALFAMNLDAARAAAGPKDYVDFYQSARFAREMGERKTEAMGWLDEGMKRGDSFWMDELKGDLLADDGKYAEGAPHLEKAIEGSKKAGTPEEWRDGARKKLAEWAAQEKMKARKG